MSWGSTFQHWFKILPWNQWSPFCDVYVSICVTVCLCVFVSLCSRMCARMPVPFCASASYTLSRIPALQLLVINEADLCEWATWKWKSSKQKMGSRLPVLTIHIPLLKWICALVVKLWATGVWFPQSAKIFCIFFAILCGTEYLNGHGLKHSPLHWCML